MLELGLTGLLYTRVKDQHVKSEGLVYIGVAKETWGCESIAGFPFGGNNGLPPFSNYKLYGNRVYIFQRLLQPSLQ